jgi:UDP-N-acetylmuramyl pentapeptide phosphotransferase/UDP-N-acetylglucosamine-1-phosphate transferase
MLCPELKLIKPNFQKKDIPSAAGLSFLLPLACYPALWPAIVFGLLGLADDLWGSRTVGGFKGHLKSLLAGKPTTGALKLFGGGLVALTAAWLSFPHEPLRLIVAAGIVALGANTLNLLDLRPGRACFGFALFLLPAALAAPLLFASLWPLAIVLAIEWCADSRAHAMLGDTGSNLLGALAGILAVQALPFTGQVILLTVLLALNLAAERTSLSGVIEKTPWLRALDRKLGVR